MRSSCAIIRAECTTVLRFGPMVSSALEERETSALTPAMLAEYQRTGHLVVHGLLDPAWVAQLRPGILAAFERNRRSREEITRPRTAYEEAFIQVVNMGLTEPEVRKLTWSSVL